MVAAAPQGRETGKEGKEGGGRWDGGSPSCPAAGRWRHGHRGWPVAMRVVLSVAQWPQRGWPRGKAAAGACSEGARGSGGLAGGR